MKEIPLSQGFVALVDDEDYKELIRYPWYAKKGSRKGSKYYAVNWQIGAMHRYMMDYPSKGMNVDHINHNTLDNRRCNLRVCTIKENLCNRRPNPKKKSRFLGVGPSRHKWQAKIGVNWKCIYLGTHETEEGAARAYDRAAIKYFGEFANLNFKNDAHANS